MTDAEARGEVVLKLARDPLLAHEILFSHRHPDAIPVFHEEIILDLHGPSRSVLEMAFRGAAKSTLAEEALIIEACLQRFRNLLVVGETYDRAVDRLRAVKREFENNELIAGLFGALVGPIWHEAKIELSNGIVIQALGQGQAVRGMKHLDVRPDYLLIDDLESAESVATPEARRKLSDWVYGDLFPALDPHAVRRALATPLDPEAWAVGLLKSDDWLCRVYPIEYVDDEGARRATWESRFPLEWIDRQKAEYARAGKSLQWEQEAMCRAVDPATRIFTEGMIRCEPQVKTWHATYAVYDPARTTNKTSSTTGRVVASWVNNRLIVWEATGEMWKPDEILDDMFAVDEKYGPVAIGVEQDGLHEFIMQPLRHAQVQRGHLLPIRPLKAPKGKVDFIKSLQPFFKAREVIFAGERAGFDEAIHQFVGFPTGKVDVPNALAYMLLMRPGLPVFSGFSLGHVKVNATRAFSEKLYLALNANNQTTAGALIGTHGKVVTVYADFMFCDGPGESLDALAKEAALAAGKAFVCYAPRDHFDTLNQIGLRAAARNIPLEVRRGGDAIAGQEELRKLLGAYVAERPAFQVSEEASWTLRALAGGYARKPGRDDAEDNCYAVLMEGVQALVGVLKAGLENKENIHYDYTSDGRKFISLR